MLSRGFSLLEMLLALALTSLISLSMMDFYVTLQRSITQIYQQHRLEELTYQAIAGLVKDIKRAGFIANKPSTITEPAIIINTLMNCIILRYDADSVGKWRYNSQDAKMSDSFAYRWYKNNLEYQMGVTHCNGLGWDKLFDPNEIKVSQFSLKQYSHVIEIKLALNLKHDPTIAYQLTQYIKNEN